jgi:hypothetical protein
MAGPLATAAPSKGAVDEGAAPEPVPEAAGAVPEGATAEVVPLEYWAEATAAKAAMMMENCILMFVGWVCWVVD